MSPQPLLLKRVSVHGYRSIRDAGFSPGPVAALVGDPGSGKSNLLGAIRAVLDPESAPLSPHDVCRHMETTIGIEVETGSEARATMSGSPPQMTYQAKGDLPPVLFLPARLRAGELLAPGRRPSAQVEVAARLLSAREEPDGEPGATEAAHRLVAGIETWHRAGLTGMVLLIEEPELFLPPQTQRYLYRLFRRLAEAGNQVIYATHSPSFLNVARLHELVLTDSSEGTGTRLHQPEPLPQDEEFRAYSEFDAARSELFLARAAVLVEGLTEKLALPFVFHALGYDPDRERISIIECGGKSNIPLVAGVSQVVRIPFLAVYDRDAPAGEPPNQGEQHLNRLIVEVAGEGRSIELAPDFEGVAGHAARRNKPWRAWASFSEVEAADLPATLVALVERAVELARSEEAHRTYPVR